MKTLLTLLTTLLCTLTAIAQTINGTVTDAATNENLSYATITIKDTVQQKVLAFTYSNNNGTFELALPTNKANTLLTVQFMGYQNYTKVLGSGTIPTPLHIALQPVSNELAAVTVTQQQRAVTLKGDKTIFNIEQAGIGSGNNGLETMEQLPGIKLDKDEKLVFRGNTGVQIMINGRKTMLEGAALTEYLRALQGDEIQSVEIIAQPSARYDASGTTGIINIVLKKGKKPGINGTVYAQAKYGEYFKELYGGRVFYTDSVWNINTSGYYYDGNSVNHRKVKQTIVLDEGIRNLNQTNEWLPRTISKNLNLGVERKLGNNHLLSTEWQLYNSLEKERTYGTTVEHTNGQLTNQVALNQTGYTPSTNVTGNVFYNFTSDSATTKLDAQVNYAYYKKELSGEQRNEYSNGAIMALAGVNNTKYNLMNAQIDFNTDVTKQLHAEAGAKYSHVAMDYYNEYETNNEELLFIPDSLLINNFEYNEHLVAAYTQLSLELKKWNLQAGLRMESFEYNAVSKVNSTVNKNSYTNWFPSFSVNYKEKNHQYQFAYSRRIGRPSYLSLNPYYRYIDAYTLSIGNPALQPRMYHSFQVSYIYKNAVNLSLYGYLYNKGFIDVVDYIEGENYNLTYTANAGKGQSFGVSVSVPYQVKDWWGVQLDAEAAYTHDTATIPEYTYSGSGFNYGVSLYQKFSLPKDWAVTVNGFYYGRGTEARGYTRANYDVSFAVSKFFWNEKMRVVAGCANILKKNLYSNVATVNNVTTDWTNKWETRRFYVQLNYYFGGKKDSKSIKGASLRDEKGRM